MKQWYEMDRAEVLSQLQANETKGLSQHEVQSRLERDGRNAFDAQKKDGIGKMILHQLRDISAIILLFAGFLSLALAIREGHGYIEPTVIFGIVIMNLILGITQERSAERALEALSQMNSPSCMVLRGGTQLEINTDEVVPGDIILLKTGDLVPADGRLLQSTGLSIDEASLTGESEPSEKEAQCMPEGETALGDQCNMVFSGCLVVSGNARAVVTATGMHTQMGKIAGYLNNSQKLRTPLQVRLNKIGRMISFVAIVSAVVLLAIGLLQGEEL